MELTRQAANPPLRPPRRTKAKHPAATVERILVARISGVLDKWSAQNSQAGVAVNTGTKGTDALGLDAIARAFEEISRTDSSRPRAEGQEFRQIEMASPLSVESDADSPHGRLEFGKVAAWSLIGFLAIAGVGVTLFAWPFSEGRTDKPNPGPLKAMEKQPDTPQAIPSLAGTRIDKSPEQSTVQPQTRSKPAEPAVSVPPDMTRQIQTLEQRLITLEQAIEQIKTDQAKQVRDSSELLRKLGEAQEQLVLRVEGFVGDVKAAEEKAARDRLTAAEQLRGNQEQLVKIAEQLKASQDQIDQLKLGAQRRAARLAPPQPQPKPQPQPPNTASTAKPAPKPPPPQARVSPAQSSRQPQIR